ncbi:MAG: phosphate ABC transporter permease subunit PstC [Verrucomicrobia bacterium GWF2_62_7]|nr:MAG: phosphate ABC transporter permease subunit PstC [Verrucomicrobia bacterium GWF2_62_7]
MKSAPGSAKARAVPRRVNLAEAIVRRRLRWGEGLVERGVFLVSLSAILMIFLIFVFVGREALPVALGRTSNARGQKAIAAAEIPKLGPEKLATYLGVTVAELKSYDAEMIRQLVELKGQELKEIANPDARLNTTSWSLMVEPYRWHGYDKAEYIWQPVSEIPKFNIVPLIIGSLKATLVALLLSVPLGVGAAIYVSQLARPALREIVKPTIELLSGIPSVVLGFFALIVMASVLQAVFGYESRLNAFVAGVALGLTVIPIIFTISEDALSSVPKAYTHAALALGASPWKAAWQVVLPAAVPGVFAACVLGFGRAIGETMVVLMASGNASIVSASIFESCRTLTASIAAELAEVVFGGDHYRILFLLGALLFAVTFATNLAGDVVMHRLKQRLEGKH